MTRAARNNRALAGIMMGLFLACAACDTSSGKGGTASTSSATSSPAGTAPAPASIDASAPAPPDASTPASDASALRPDASTNAGSPGAIGPFLRERPEERAGVDACAYLGGAGFACLDALLEEKDPVKKRYMRRLSDADARLSFEDHKKGQDQGVAHAELALFCAESGPCKQKSPEGVELDDGYACLTKAQGLLMEKEAEKSKKAHERACECDPVRAQIPVMAGFLACDGPNKPVERGKELSLAEANEIRACAECDPKKGPAACAREIERLRTKDAEVVQYLQAVHIPRCQRK